MKCCSCDTEMRGDMRRDEETGRPICLKCHERGCTYSTSPRRTKNKVQLEKDQVRGTEPPTELACK